MARFGSQLIALFTASIVSCVVFCTTASADVWSLPDTHGTKSIAAGVDPRNGEPVLYSVRRNKLFKLSLTSGITEELLPLREPKPDWMKWSEFHLAVDREGKVIISDINSQSILEYDLITRTLTRIAGRFNGINDGSLATRFIAPEAIAVDKSNKIIVIDRDCAIREIDRKGNRVKTMAYTPSDGGNRDGVATPGAAGTHAQFGSPTGIALDNEDNVFFSDGQSIRRLDRRNGTVSTIAGDMYSEGDEDGPAHAARFKKPTGLAFDHEGNLLIADKQNQLIRKLNLAKRHVTTFADPSITRPDWHVSPTELVVVPHNWPLAGGIFVAAPHGIYFIGPDDNYEQGLERIVKEGMSAATIGDQAGLDRARQQLINLSKAQTNTGQIAQVISESRRDPENSLLGRLVTDLHPQLNNLLTYQAFNGLRGDMALQLLPVTANLGSATRARM